MAFNWFRRTFEQAEPATAQEQSPDSASKTAPADAQPLQPTSQPVVNTDLLSWAKAAYTNIQHKQAVPVPEAMPEQVASETSETTEEAHNPPPSEAVPFWMQSAEQIQARVAELSANALPEESAVEPQPVVGKVNKKSLLAFDQEFLWSAEVLAKQGRKPEDISAEEITWLNRLRVGLGKTRLSLVNQLKGLVGMGPLSADAVEDIEALLLQADVGVQATDRIIQTLQDKLRAEVLPPAEAIAYLKQLLRETLDAHT